MRKAKWMLCLWPISPAFWQHPPSFIRSFMFGLLGWESQEQLGWGAKNSHLQIIIYLILSCLWHLFGSINRSYLSIKLTSLYSKHVFKHGDGRENSMRLLVPPTDTETIYIFLQLLIKSNMRYGNFAAGTQPWNKSITPVLMWGTHQSLNSKRCGTPTLHLQQGSMLQLPRDRAFYSTVPKEFCSIDKTI